MLLLIHFIGILAALAGLVSLAFTVLLGGGYLFVNESRAEHAITGVAFGIWLRRTGICGVLALACYLAGR